METADRLDYLRIHQVSLRENETKGEQNVHLKSMTSTYQNKKTLESKRYLNIVKSHIPSGVNDTMIDEQSMGNMTYHCSYCHSKFWEDEKLSTSTKRISKFSLCCGEGKVVLPPLDNLPELLAHLLTSTDIRGEDFGNQIHAYNSSLAFCSLGANINKELANARGGVYTFCVQGVVHHFIGSLVPNSDETSALYRSTSMTVLLKLKLRTVRDI